MKLWTILLAVMLGTLFATSTALAQDTIRYKKRTIIDLSGATIEGELTKPEGSYLVIRKLSRFSTLIQARGDYIPELLTSHNEL